MALGTFSIGEYTATYNSNAIGLVSSGGYNLKFRPSVQPINDTATYGDTLIDGVYRGISGVQVVVTVKEWNTAVKQILWPFGDFASPTFSGALGVIGKLISDAAKSLVLTAVTGTPAATNGPATFTAAKAILSPANDVSIIMGPTQRDVPLLFDLLLYDDSGTKRFFALT
jgi:hypothetical protein